MKKKRTNLYVHMSFFLFSVLILSMVHKLLATAFDLVVNIGKYSIELKGRKGTTGQEQQLRCF